jgi:choline-sulfatase
MCGPLGSNCEAVQRRQEWCRKRSASSARVLGIAALAIVSFSSCAPAGDPSSGPDEQATAELPSILLVTLDTTRADAVGFESDHVETPALEALAARGARFAQAYATAPLTLPSHVSMHTGLYPRDHGIHENSRVFDRGEALLAPRLRERGYRTAAFVSALPLARQFGLHAGFERYDDAFGSANERRATDTTDLAVELLRETGSAPMFLWVHYFDPHDPYDPPEPFRSRYAGNPYLGEIAYMDSELGRLVAAFETSAAERPWRILVVGDHGEGMGDHGETFHGNLLYQGVMRVPLVIAGSELAKGRVVTEPVSIRRVHHTILGWASVDSAEQERSPESAGLLDGGAETVFAEGMKPFLEYGWEPQVMAVEGSVKAIWAGRLEVYDLAVDPREARDLAGEVELDAGLLAELREYAVPGRSDGERQVDEDTRARLAALGYTSGEGSSPRRPDAPAPRDMAHLFADLDLGSGLFLQHRYEEAIPVLERLARADPGNVTVHLRLAVARSVLGQTERAEQSFERARALASDSADVRHYLGLHYLRLGRLADAERLLAEVLGTSPDRLPTLEALAEIRARQGRLDEAADLVEQAMALATSPSPRLLVLAGELGMARGDTTVARDAFERARVLQGEAFAHHLELGVLYLAERRFVEARDSLDRVPSGHPARAMALFKRAQVSVLLGESDREQRVAEAWRNADAEVRDLMLSERLFAGLAFD